MAKKKTNNFNNIINLGVSFALIVLGIILLILPWFGIRHINALLYILFSIYAIIKLIEYLITNAGEDREDLYSSIACMLVALSGLWFIGKETPMVLSLTLTAWIGLMSIIKLIKLDYYHDREEGMLYVNLVTFILFLIMGLLTCGNLYFGVTVQTLILGYFFIINGILNLGEDAFRILIQGGLQKINNK